MTQPLFVSPDWPVDSSVRVLTTTRLGGVSKPPFDSMNLGLHVADKSSDVLENRQRLSRYLQLPSEPCWLNQTHSAMVSNVDIDEATLDKAFDKDADGAYTELPDTVLAILTADCLPVVISDVRGACMAVVHAGWRGLAAGIVEQALGKFDNKSELYAWLGPGIGPHAFEVGDDVKRAFVEQNSADASYFSPGTRPGKFWANLYALATSRLLAGGCSQVSGGEYCTYTNRDLFHSHRRDGIPSGRMATLIWRSEASIALN